MEELNVYVNWNDTSMVSFKNTNTLEYGLYMSTRELDAIDLDRLVYEEDLNNIDYTKIESLSRLVIQKQEELNIIRGFMMTVIPDEEYISLGNDLRDISYHNINENYSGLILYYNMDGSLNNGWKYLDGQLVSGFIKKKQDGVISRSLQVIEVTRCFGSSTGSTADMTFEYTTTCHTSRVFIKSLDAPIGAGGGGSSSDDDPWKISGGGGNISEPVGGYISPKKLEPLEESKVDDDVSDEFANSPANCIKIMLEDGSTLNILLEGFDLDGYNGKLTFTLGDLSDRNANGLFDATTYRTNGTVTSFTANITIDRDAVSSNSWIELARTILHESFHAYMYTKLVTNNAHNGLMDEPDFSDVWKLFESLYGSEVGHNYMANYYITFMETALKEIWNHPNYYSERIKFENHVSDMSSWDGIDNFLERLCWTGLKKTEAWNDYQSNSEKYAKYNATYQNIVPLLTSAKNCK